MTGKEESSGSASNSIFLFQQETKVNLH